MASSDFVLDRYAVGFDTAFLDCQLKFSSLSQFLN